ncbi:MAG: response regulator, partial [Proteobacteria bacterium]
DNIKADPHQIELVIMNLVINARDAMPTGGAITIETRNEHLTEEFASTHLSSKLGPHVVFTVTDTGTGIEEAVRSKIFEPFFTTKAFGTATGLGLSTVYGIVKSLEGTIWVYSEVGQGTVFKIYIPVASENASALNLIKPGYDQLGGTETVLVVEDDSQLRGIYQDLLQQNGYKVLLSENGKEALRLVQSGSSKIDLIVTDMVMPEMGGAELGENLISLRPDAKILFISGYSGDRVDTSITELKNTRYLQKPFNTQAMLAKIRELLAA